MGYRIRITNRETGRTYWHGAEMADRNHGNKPFAFPHRHQAEDTAEINAVRWGRITEVVEWPEGTPERAADAPDVAAADAALVKHLQDIEAGERRATKARMEWEASKEETSARKKAYDVACEELCEIIREGKQPTLFGGVSFMSGDVKVTIGTPPENVAAEPAPAAPKPDPDAWRADPIDVLKLPEKYAGKLRDAGLTTVGEIEIWRAGENKEPTVIRWGKVAQQALADAMEAYHMARVGPAATADKTGPAGGPVLKWEVDAPDAWSAQNTAGLLNEVDGPAWFFVTHAEDGHFIEADRPEMSDGANPFPSLAEAQQWAESRNAALVAARQQPPADGPAAPVLGTPLVWVKSEAGERYVAANTAGVIPADGDDFTPANFVVSPDGSEFTVFQSADELLPADYPKRFASVDDGKTWCQNRNRVLAQAAEDAAGAGKA